MKAKISIVFLIVGLWVFISIIGVKVYAQGTENSWNMAGANPQRTSWVADEPKPNNYNSYGVIWYRPIEAYISQHTQIVAARGKIYVATARGLYAMEADTGNTVWKYDTEIPLGHSPTVVGNTVYVGGFDRKVHALDADTGSVRWIFDQAQAGFSTNPLVVDGKVFMGSRDGYFYALDAATGALAWQYPRAGQAPLGPILYSAAYKDGDLYFASNDHYGYALNAATGNLKWRSNKLPGDGYQAWWPVVYKDYVIFSAAVGYKPNQTIGDQSIYHTIPANGSYSFPNIDGLNDYIYGIQGEEIMHPNNGASDMVGAEIVTGSAQDQFGINWAWKTGETVMDGQRITEFLEDDGQVRFDRAKNKPWRRTTIALNLSNGQEYSFDSDNDGNPEYIPFVAVGTKTGNQYPPIVLPDKNNTPNEILYKKNLSYFIPGYGIDYSAVMGWYPESKQYLHLTDVAFYIDEPLAISGGCNVLYYNLCCDRVGGWTDMANSQGNPHEVSGLFWSYGATLESLDLLPASDLQPWNISVAPGYDEMWWESSMHLGLPRLGGGYGSLNTVYHNHGLQNPIIPYQDKLFTHRSNAIIALGPNPPEVPASAQLPANPTKADHQVYEAALKSLKKRPLLTYNKQKQDNVRQIPNTKIKQLLETQVLKMVNAGHLRPGYYGIGQHDYSQFDNYFENPGDTLLTLSLAYPYLPPGLQARVKIYLQEEYNHYFKNTMYFKIGWYEDPVDPAFGQLAGRESMPLPPEVEEHIKSQQKTTWSGYDWPWSYPPQNLYALWKYAEIEPSEVNNIYNLAKSKLDLYPPYDSQLIDNPWEHNAYIAGYIGFINLQQLANMDTTDANLKSQVEAELQRLLDLRATTFDKDQPWVGDKLVGLPGGAVHRRNMNIARNFLYLTPELGDYLNANAFSKVKEAVDEYNWVSPYWFVARYEASVSEGVQRQLYDYWAVFQAKAHILKEPFDSLTKYLDSPAFEVGDLFYIQNLIATLQASEGPILSVADINQDGIVDISDYAILASEYLQTGSGLSADLNSDGLVDISDYAILAANYLL